MEKDNTQKVLDVQEENKLKMVIYDNKRVMVKMHDFNPFENRREGKHVERIYDKDAKMTTKEYKRTIRRWQKKLWSMKVESENCRFITLKLYEQMDWDTLLSKFSSFMTAVKRRFGRDVQFVRAVEFHEYSQKYHIHLVLVFKGVAPAITGL